MKKIVITGAEGQLGKEIVQFLNSIGNYDVYGFGKSQLDVTNEHEVKKVIEPLRPQTIIHCAAYTHVDRAETEKDQAFLINRIGTENVTRVSEEIKSKLVYISTDYVFDGCSSIPYDEFSLPSPINVYGRSKLAGEKIVKELHSRYFIVRTSWLYGSFGENFVKTMLKLARENEELLVVTDQIGSPTYTVDLTKQLVSLIETDIYGTYHISNEGSCSWHEFAVKIFKLTNSSVTVKKCLTKDFPRPAKRPPYSVLDNIALRLYGFNRMPDWQDGLRRLLQQIKVL